jgi:hypothetical protein
MYSFDDKCHLKLDVSYKRDIVCNSSYNVTMKSTAKFPKSYLKLELRKGIEVVYSYYIDLYDNVDKNDVEHGFMKLKSELVGNEVNQK